MALIRINPNRFKFSGDITSAKKFIGHANSQMEILRQSMSFQNLFQGIRRVQIADDVFIECRKFGNFQTCSIYVTPTVVIDESFEFESTLIVVISLKDNSEAIAWDIINDQIVGEQQSFDDLITALADEDFTSFTQLGYSSSWEENRPSFGNTDQDGEIPDSLLGYVWPLSSYETNINDISPYNEDYNSWNFNEMLDSGDTANGVYFKILANAFYDNGNTWAIGDYITFTTVKASEVVTNLVVSSSAGFDSSKLVGDILGAITENWTAIMVDSPVGINVHIYGETVGPLFDSGIGALAQMAWEDNNIGFEYVPYTVPLSYFNYLELPEYDETPSAYFFRKDDGFKKEEWQSYFESSSGYSWPYGMDYIIREAVFYHPLFGPDMTDLIPFSAQMKTASTFLYDSFIDGDWSEPALVEDSGGTIDGQNDLAHNRVDVCSTIGVGNSYTPVDVSDLTEITAAVVFDAFCFLDYVGSGNDIQMGINIQYRLNDVLSGDNEELFNLINAERVNENLDELRPNHILQIAAVRQATDMATNAWNDHIGTDGSNWYDRAEDAGYFINRPKPYCFVGENIGEATLDSVTLVEVVAAWMASSGHRDNILLEDYTETGIAIVEGDNGISYFAQVFGGKSGAWAGFGAFDTTNLTTYLNENFSFLPTMPDDFISVYASQKDV